MTKGQRIRKMRTEKGLFQSDLAKLVGVSKQTLYKYERDIVSNIPSDVIEKLASALDCSPEFLMGWDVEWEGEPFNDPDFFEVEWRRRGGGAHKLILTEEEENFILEARTIKKYDADFYKRMMAYIKAIKEMEQK